MAPGKRAFESDVAQTMQILVHSLYRERDIFLRELVSNAVDAIHRFRITQMTREEVVNPAQPQEIYIETDKDNNTLTIRDGGCGMTESELVEQLGTIAHSGSRKFIQSLSDDAASRDLIGQFGVGFYAVFMVAEHVTVTSRSWQPDTAAATWSSNGSDGYETDVLAEAPSWRGTEIRLRLRADAAEYLEPERIRAILSRYSRFVPFPVQVNGETAERSEPVWMQTPATVTEDQYKSFYGYLAGGAGDPTTWLHVHSDAPVDLKAILYVPGMSLLKFGMEDQGGVALYRRKVLIDGNAEELLPQFLRFMKGLADSEDVELNVSRETVQNSPVFRRIRKVLTGRVLKHLGSMLKSDREKYEVFFGEFGPYLKDGILREMDHQSELADLLLFNLADTGEFITLSDYLARSPEATAIYYIAGADQKKLEASPHLEYYRKEKIPVLLLPQPLDELVVGRLGQYKEIPFKLVSQSDEQTGAQEGAEPSDSDPFLVKLAQLLSDRVRKVRYSTRLVDSPYCLVTTGAGMSASMEQMMRAMNENYQPEQRVLELNPEHELVRKLKDRVASGMQPELTRLIVHQIVDSALLLDHQVPPVNEMAGRLNRLMDEVLSAQRGQSDGTDLASDTGEDNKS